MFPEKIIYDQIQKKGRNDRLSQTVKLIRRQVNITNQLDHVEGKDKHDMKLALDRVNRVLSDQYGNEYRSICKYVYSKKLNLTSVDESLIDSKSIGKISIDDEFS